jgi:hypothetical protein
MHRHVCPLRLLIIALLLDHHDVLALQLLAPVFTNDICNRTREEGQFARVLDKISRLPSADLGNSSIIADLVREVGMVKDGRPLYGFGGKAGSEKKWMHARRGFGMYQLPKQVGCLLSAFTSLPTRLRTFVEIGAWYGWTGLFFSVYTRRLFKANLQSAQSRDMARTPDNHLAVARQQEFRSASFDIADMRTQCVKTLMSQTSHDFHVAPNVMVNGTHVKLQLFRTPAKAEAWYRSRLAASFKFNSTMEKIDICFIDAEHIYRFVVADLRFFLPLCHFLLFHDIVDSDTKGVRRIWSRLRNELLLKRDKRSLERGERTEPGAPASEMTMRDMMEGYYVKECTQQAGTNRKNFGLGLISTRYLNSSWFDS